MARRSTNTREYKVTLNEALHPFLEHLAALGLYGASPSEVIRKLTESALEERINAGTFEKAAMAMKVVSEKKATSADNS